MQPDGSRAFVSCTPDDYIALVDLKTLEVTGHLDVGKQPDGLAWVSLSPIRDAALLLSAVAQALEVKEQPGRELADALVAHLAGRRQLLRHGRA